MEALTVHAGVCLFEIEMVSVECSKALEFHTKLHHIQIYMNNEHAKGLLFAFSTAAVY